MTKTLETLRKATLGTEWEENLYLVGGYIRDQLLGLVHNADIDLVTTRSAPGLAEFLFAQGVADCAPVTYPRFGTAMVRIEGTNIELVTARKESYGPESRKPEVKPATLEEDANRRDFTVNALMRNLHTGELLDLTGRGQTDLKLRLLRTPTDALVTFRDDPLRMLRAVRFRWQLGFNPAPGLYEAIRVDATRLAVISAERIQEEFVKMLSQPTAASALRDLMDLGLLPQFLPEAVAMVGIDQGHFHSADVWNHTLAVIENLAAGDPLLTLAALLHDIGKPETKTVDAAGNIRFFGHEAVGAAMASRIMRRLKFGNEDVATVERLVKGHMRLGSAPEFTASAARRLIRDLDSDLDRLLALVEADSSALKEGVKSLNLDQVRARIAEVRAVTPRDRLESPLNGEEIMEALGIDAGPEVGKAKSYLTERVIEGDLAPDDKVAAKTMLARFRE